jgi:glycosyltransferase involved in cell wall biosynthesis
MRRVLMVSPHFPPDTSAGTHRVRLLAPHLRRHGWEPTIVTVDPRDYEGRLDAELAELVPADLRVVRVRALPVALTRALGVGDLGLRALPGLRRTCARLLGAERFHALFITMYPTYPALLGPGLKRRFGVPFVLDYQDPWVGAWGRDVGGGRDGRPDWKSRLTRALALRLEPRALRAADAVTAVSEETYADLRSRYGSLAPEVCAAIPLGGEPADFDRVRREPGENPYFDPKDGHVHVCYVGTLLPLGFETLRAVLRAAALLRERRPEIYARLQLRFFGTSNQTTADAPARVLPVARELGVADRVTEIAPRIGYLDALRVQTQAGAILMMGSSERHYTASKLYPGLLAERPILAVYHEASSVVDILRRAARPPAVHLVTYDDAGRAETRVAAICEALVSLVERPVYEPGLVDMAVVAEYSAEAQARSLAGVLDRVGAGA